MAQAQLVEGTPVPILLTPEFLGFPLEPGSLRHSVVQFKGCSDKEKSNCNACHLCWSCEATSVYCIFPRYISVTVDK